jgi:hypothetical protein
LTRNTVFSFLGGKPGMYIDDDVSNDALLDIDGFIETAAAAAIAALFDAAMAATASVSSNVTVCAVTLDGNPAPCRTPAIIPLR